MASADDDAADRTAELEALDAIFGALLQHRLDPSGELFTLRIEAEEGSASPAEDTLLLDFALPETYPSAAPPTFRLRLASGRTVPSVATFQTELLAMWVEGAGAPVIYTWVEHLRERLPELLPTPQRKRETVAVVEAPELEDMERSVALPEIVHGDAFTDRRSTFQAHAAVVHSQQEVRAVREALMSYGKVARASHNIAAWRVFDVERGALCHDNDDDGESAAGGRLAELLALTGVEDVVVVVSRWFGGIHLGPDRFKHINNAARSLLEQMGLVAAGKRGRR